MSQTHPGGMLSKASGAALAVNRRVKIASGVLQYAGASDVSIGTLLNATFVDANFSSGYTNGTVQLVISDSTRKSVALDAITAGNPVYAAANGKVASTGTIVEGRALEASTADGDVIEVMSISNTDVSATINGTNAAAFEVDADATTPKLAISGQSGGTGDYTTTLKPETTLSADNTMIVPEADGDTLVAKALAQTLTNKTLTSPTLTTPLLGDGDTGITITSANQTHAAPTATVPDIADAADTFVMADTTQTLTGKTLTSPVLNALPKFQNTVTPVAAAGTTVADAGQLASTMVNHITSDGASKGVKFPTGAQNHLMIVINDSATAAELYAASGGTVNGLSADASVVIPASKGVLAFCTAANTWIVFDMTAKATAS